MPRPWNEEVHGNFSDFLSLYFQGENTISQSDELSVCFELMRDADSLGSIMKFDINDSTRLLVKQTTNFWCSQEFVPDNIRLQIPTFKLILALTEKYDALVMNPPYMGGGNMNEVLGSYCANYYQEGKADLMTVFMQKSMNATTDKGYWAMINLPSWMFLPSFEQIRDQLINTQCICSLNYNGRGIFGSDFGSVSFIIKNVKKPIIGIYRKLFTIQGSVRSNDEIKTNYEDRNFGRYLINQNEFLKVPGKALAFWLPMTILDSFNHKISDFAIAKKGLSTGNNNLFLRLWFEVSKNKSIYETDNFDNDKTWYPINKGGGYRKWYGNNEYVINWKNNGADIKHFAGSVIRNPQYYLKESLTWTMLSASCFGVRYSKAGKLFEGAGPSLFADKNQLYFILSFLCSKLGNLIIRALNPTINININDVLNLPLKQVSSEIIENISVNNICISKNDWDSHETSWDFEVNPVLAVNENTYIDNINHEIEQHEKETGEHICIDPAAPELGSLQWRIEQYKKKWTHLFMQLYANEVELNRQFIEIYELQDGLTPDVPLSEITILQHGEINVADESLSWNDEVLMKQLISYAVGCMLGRYRLDRPGLHIAHPDPTDEETASYMYNEQTWEIDDDGIMPLMTNDCGFSDNASYRFADFLRVALGEEVHVENLNYVEQCLGKTIEQYFVKDFWKDHKKMYQNRPIYWLFASKKGSFQVIAYMHRMNAYTVERIRAKYLLPFIEHLEQEINKLDLRRAELTTKESKMLQTLQKQLDECREYHERLQVVAEQAISFDLDDGVAVNYAKFGDVLQKVK